MRRGGSSPSLPPPLAHAYAEVVATAFAPHPRQQLFYDEPAGCLHVLVNFTLTTVRFPPVSSTPAGAAGGVGHQLPRESFTITQGAPVLLVRAQPLQPPSPAQPQREQGESHYPAAASAQPAAGSLAAPASGAGGAVTSGAGSHSQQQQQQQQQHLVAIQRSSRLVEFADAATGSIAFLESPAERHGRPALLRGFFWASAPACQFVMVTDQGLEMHTVQPGGQGLKLEGLHRLAGVRWYSYCHRTRMALVGCGEGGAKLQAFQFTSAAVIKLPLLDLAHPPAPAPSLRSVPAPAAAAVAALPGAAAASRPAGPAGPAAPAGGLLASTARLLGRGSAAAAAALGRVAAPPPPPPTASPETVWVVSLYGRVYCCWLDKAARVLRLYRMYRDAVLLAHEFEVFSDSVLLSTADSVLIVHDAHSGCALLLDVMAGSAGAGISNSSRSSIGVGAGSGGAAAAAAVAAAGGGGGGGGGGAKAAVAAAERGDGAIGGSGSASGAPLCAPLPLGLPPGLAAPGQRVVMGIEAASAATLAGTNAASVGTTNALVSAGAGALPPLLLCPPCWLVDPSTGALLRVQLDLAALVETSSDWVQLVALLQRRAPEQGAGHPGSPFELTLQVVKTVLQERVPLHTAARVFQAVNLAYRDAVALVEAAPADSPASLGDYPVVSPEAMCTRVFGWLREEQVIDSLSLQAALAQYVSSCHSFGIAVPPCLASLYVETLLDQGRGHLVGPLLASHLLLDSASLAEQLEELQRQGRLPEGRQLARDMYRRLRQYGPYCASLLQESGACGATTAALRTLQRRRVDSISPSACLDAAAAARDEVLFAGVYRLCRDRVKPFLPGFAHVRGQYGGRWAVQGAG